MSDSQSRYSIIERLTNTKLELMNQENEIDNEITNAENKTKYLAKELTTLKDQLNKQVENEMKRKEKELEQSKDEVAILKAKKTSISQILNKKLTEIERAIKAVEDVSKSALTEEKN